MIRFLRNVFFLFLLSYLLTGCTIPFLKNSKQGALNVTSSPKASIFLDGKHIGSTHYYDDKVKPGEYTIRLVPENGAGMPWEARIQISPGILTVISRELGETFDTSSGHVLTLEPVLAKDEVGMLVTTVPEGAVVNVDGEPRGFAPISINDISVGDHAITISSPGYIDKSFNAKLELGHKLIASIQLAKSTQAPPVEEIQPVNTEEEDAEDEEEEDSKALDADIDEKENEEERLPLGADLKPPFVTVLDTPTGWLNVRKEPSTASEILLKANPGDSFAYIDLNETGWFQIKLTDKQEGWVSSKYVKLTKESTNSVEDKD